MSLVDASAVLVSFASPSPVACCYLVFAAVLVVGLAVIFLRGDWHRARGFDKLILFGPLFYAAPLAAFGTEHFTITTIIASMVPRWIPWHLFWAYFVGACFIAAGFSIVTKVQARLAASLVGLTFLIFVASMDVPGWLRNPGNRLALALALRELSFGAGALALVASLSESRERHPLATIARYFIAVAVLVYSFEQFRHADHVPGVPLQMVTPAYVVGHAIWTYVTAAVYAVGGVLLLIGKKTRAAATSIGGMILVGVLIVYVPIAVVERASLVGFNYLADTLMFCGAVLLLAGAMPQEEPVENLSRQEAVATGR